MMSHSYSRKSARHTEPTSLLSWSLIALIYLYRYSFRPMLGHVCRFQPTCSHYAEEAIRTHGAWPGSILAVRRILKCHPWHIGGYDPVPDQIAPPQLNTLSHEGNNHCG